MTNSQINTKFLADLDKQTRSAILANIADHYGCTPDEAFAEVTNEEAEHLLDYVTGPSRAIAHLLMRVHA